MSKISEPSNEEAPSLKRLLNTLKLARNQLEAIEYRKTEPIAIIGMGCRFPFDVKNPQDFWELLHNGVDAISEIPKKRWDIDSHYDPDPDMPGKMYTRYGGFVSEVDTFDPVFFGISPKEAECMDPQQRMLLEVSWEAIENAGLASEKLQGSSTGLFVGISFDDYSRLSINSGDASLIDAYTSLGNSKSIAVGRLAYILGIHGPVMQLDTSCSSSLLGVHLACQSLRSEECNLALAGGVNLMLSPEITIGLSKLKALAADGRCKTFDASADGYARGEGCGILVLKRQSDALADGNNILALIRGSAVNHDGRSNGLTAPNGSAQEAVIRQALENGRVKPEEIQYVEAHGTGTSLGDPIEVLALSKVLGQGRSKNEVLYIGSVKTNFGHLEAASGVAGIMKVVLSLQNKKIPPSLHFRNPNPYIPWEKIPITVPTKPIPWSDSLKCAGVSSFGMSGTNVHVILETAPVNLAASSKREKSERPLHLFTLSAKTEKALRELAQSYEAFLLSNNSVTLADVCFTANIGRSHFNHCLAVVSESTVALREELQNFLAGKKADGLLSGQVTSRKRPKIAFLFAGEKQAYIGMGRQLYETQPTFRAELVRCDEILRPYLDKSLLDVLYPASGKKLTLDNIDIICTKIALFALEYAFFQLWKSWGIEPDALMGYGIGEYVVGCVAGVFSLEEALKLIITQEKLTQQLLVADNIVAEFAATPYKITYNSPQIPIISPVTGQQVFHEVTTPKYWEDLELKQVELTTSTAILKLTGYEVFLEINPGEQSLEWQQILLVLGKFYIHGVNIDWSGFNRDYAYSRVILPNYPFQRERYWMKTNAKALSYTRQTSKLKHQDLKKRPLHILTLSAKTQEALDQLVTTYQNYLEANPELELTDICYTSNIGRTQFQHRLAVVAASQEELTTKLTQAKLGELLPGVFQKQLLNSTSILKIAFLFTGQGSQYVNMGRQLYETQPVFHQALDQCQQILSAYLDQPLLSVLYPSVEQVQQRQQILDKTAYTQPAVFAIEYALVQLWKFWGIKPDVLVGHSVGEYVAACIAGVFSLEDALKLIAFRSYYMQQLPPTGEMVAVMAGADLIQSLMTSRTEQVAIAAFNGPHNTVLSGTIQAIREICDSLSNKGIKFKKLEVSHAFHSPLMEPMLAEFEKLAHQVTYNQPQIPIISNLTGLQADESIASAKYWVTHVCQPVQFAQSIKTLHELRYEVFLEIGSKPTLLGMGQQCLPEHGLWLPSLRPRLDEWQQMLSSLGQLYVQGIHVDWSGFHWQPSCQKEVLPTHPFQQQRYWLETTELTENRLENWQQYSHKKEHPLLGYRLQKLAHLPNTYIWETEVNEQFLAYIKHNRSCGAVLMPHTAYIEMGLAVAEIVFGSECNTINDLVIHNPLLLSQKRNQKLQTILSLELDNLMSFHVYSSQIQKKSTQESWTLCATAKIPLNRK